MMETGLESVAYNLNRKNADLQFFEFGKIYSTDAVGQYVEEQRLSIFITGSRFADSWKTKAAKADIYFAKAVCSKIIQLLGLNLTSFQLIENDAVDMCLNAKIDKETVALACSVSKKVLDRFDIKQPVFYVDIAWDVVLDLNKKVKTEYSEIPKFPSAQRDIAIVVDKAIEYVAIEKATFNAGVKKLAAVNLFDIFESEKLGAGKKSMAINFTFLDEEKTMTDKEIDAMMGKIIASYESELKAEVRK